MSILEQGPFRLQFTHDGRVEMERGKKRSIFRGTGYVKKALLNEISSLRKIDSYQEVGARIAIAGGILLGARGIINYNKEQAATGAMLVGIGIGALVRDLPKEEIGFREAGLEEIKNGLSYAA